MSSSIVPFHPFVYQPDYTYTSGWDRYALDYCRLLQPGTVYTLTKELMYAILDRHMDLQPGMQVLDLNCGTGNDFPYFLSRQLEITGTDMSAGMLNKAAEQYGSSASVTLLQGSLEALDTDALGDKKFDLIYSVTGGFAYVDNAELLRVFRALSAHLKPGGRIITAHFSRFCAAEAWYFLSRLQLRRGLVRLRKKLRIGIKDQYYHMHLRSRKEMQRLLQDDFDIDAVHPLLAVTPPYQTGYKPDPVRLEQARQKELRLLDKPYYADTADQFVIVCRPK